MQSKTDNTLPGAASGALLVAALLLSGCQTTQISEHLPPPPAAELGPQFEVLKAPRYSYMISEAVDGAGRVHLIAVPKKTYLAHPVVVGSGIMDPKGSYFARHLVIGPQGVESSEIIRKGVQSYTVDLAFDRAGNLHALIGNEHLMKQGDQWVGGLRTPWQEAKLDSDQFYHSLGRSTMASTTPAFVKGTPDLTWTFSMSSGDRNWPGRTDWSAPMGGFPVPLPSSERAWKQIVVPEETPYRHWYALGMEDGMNVIAATESGDAQNGLYALYQGQKIGLADEDLVGHLRYVAFRMDGKCATQDPAASESALRADRVSPARGPEGAFKLENGMTICPLKGALLPVTAPPELQDIFIPLPFGNAAIESETGAMLLVGHGSSNLVNLNKKSESLAEMPLKDADLLLASAGKGRFHALASAVGVEKAVQPVYYLEYANGAWSAPVEIGKHWSGGSKRLDRVSDALDHYATLNADRQNDVFKVVNDNAGHALLMWPTEDALVARWVTLK